MKLIKYPLFIAAAVLFISATYESICEMYIPIEKGTKLTYEDYNKKDKLDGSQVMEIKDLTTVGEKTTVVVAMESFDKKGESIYKNDVEYYCENGVFKVNMETVMPTATMESMEGMEVTVEQENLAFPGKLEVGQTLPDASISIKGSMNGISVMNSNMEITDRKVEAIESITTSAGTFECFKLTSKSKSKFAFATLEMSSIDWVTMNIGSIRSESYDKKGELQGYRILSAISK